MVYTLSWSGDRRAPDDSRAGGRRDLLLRCINDGSSAGAPPAGGVGGVGCAGADMLAELGATGTPSGAGEARAGLGESSLRSARPERARSLEGETEVRAGRPDA